MRYFYIICLALSSIFTYKHLVAQEQAKQYAFFMPNDAFLQNTSVDDVEKNSLRRTPPNNRTGGKIEPEITLPYVRKKVELAQPTDESHKKADKPYQKRDDRDRPRDHSRPPRRDIIYDQPRIRELEPTHLSQQIIDDPKGGLAPSVQERLTQYSLEETLPEEDIAKILGEERELSVEEYAHLSVDDMFKKIPFPDASLPKYKQVYAAYGMDLRILHRRGDLPYNREQEEALAKANTIQRFQVK